MLNISCEHARHADHLKTQQYISFLEPFYFKLNLNIEEMSDVFSLDSEQQSHPFYQDCKPPELGLKTDPTRQERERVKSWLWHCFILMLMLVAGGDQEIIYTITVSGPHQQWCGYYHLHHTTPNHSIIQTGLTSPQDLLIITEL